MLILLVKFCGLGGGEEEEMENAPVGALMGGSL
jgi:hypothetical protein